RIRRGHRPTTGSRRVIRKFSATGILNGVSQGLITPFLVPFFVLVYHLPAGEMSLYAAASGVSATVALLFSPLLERHWGFVPSLSYTRGDRSGPRGPAPLPADLPGLGGHLPGAPRASGGGPPHPDLGHDGHAPAGGPGGGKRRQSGHPGRFGRRSHRLLRLGGGQSGPLRPFPRLRRRRLREHLPLRALLR
ncbi:multidrug ABC transporter, partial [mine drainage metagenome]